MGYTLDFSGLYMFAKDVLSSFIDFANSALDFFWKEFEFPILGEVSILYILTTGFFITLVARIAINIVTG